MTGYARTAAQPAEFFGLWTFATRLASIVGPLSYGAITWMTGGNQRVAIWRRRCFRRRSAVAMPIDMQRGGRRRCGRDSPRAGGGRGRLASYSVSVTWFAR